jgi:hypothetical protein
MSELKQCSTNFNLAETDVEFRKRILARVAPDDTETIYLVQVAIGTALDTLGKSYALVRDTGLVIDGELVKKG